MPKRKNQSKKSQGAPKKTKTITLPDEIPEDSVFTRDNGYLGSMIPIEYPNIYEFRKQLVEAHWFEHEVDFSTDFAEFQKFTEGEKKATKHVVGFFNVFDALVSDILTNLLDLVKNKEARSFILTQNENELLHNEIYGRLTVALTSDPVERKALLEAVKNFEGIRKLRDWAIECGQSRKLSRAFFIQGLIEKVAFPENFAWIYNLKKKYNTKGLTQSNELIGRDEGIHGNFYSFAYVLHGYKIKEEEIKIIVGKFIDAKILVAQEAYEPGSPGFTSKEAIEYIKYLADTYLEECGYSKMYNVENPFPWTKIMGLAQKTNFFEKKVTEYGAIKHEIGLNETPEDYFNGTDKLS